MNLKIVVLLILCFFVNKIYSQSNEIVNPIGKWFFGAELGTNKINSFYAGDSKISFQGGILSELLLRQKLEFVRQNQIP
jgi:hypothetical protein